MDDRRAHFLTMVGDTCVAARLANLTVEILTASHTRVIGVPSPDPAASPHAVDDTGYGEVLRIDGEAVRLVDVVEFAVHGP